jgi:hypothetical protein
MSRAARYAAYDGTPSRTELERFFFLDDADRALIESKRRSHNRLGFAAQLTTARHLGVFPDDLTDVPTEVVDYLAGQFGIADASVLKTYSERENTRLDHVRELRRVLQYGVFRGGGGVAGVGGCAGLDDRGGAEGVVRRGGGVAAGAAGAAAGCDHAGLWDTLHGLLRTGQRAVLDLLSTVEPGARVSELDRLRRGPVRISGPQMKWALERAEEVAAFGMGEGRRVRDTVAPAVRHRRQGVTAEAARRLPAPGHPAGHRGPPEWVVRGVMSVPAWLLLPAEGAGIGFRIPSVTRRFILARVRSTCFGRSSKSRASQMSRALSGPVASLKTARMRG